MPSINEGIVERKGKEEKSPVLSKLIVSSSKRVLLNPIEFKAAEKPYSLEINSLRTKYIPINSSKKTTINGDAECKDDKMKNPGKSESFDSLPVPQIMLYPEDEILLDWCKVKKIGSGLVNLGNTCYFNSTLQCLTYTAPLVNFCMSDEHYKSCKQVGFCLLCEMQRHIHRCFESNGHSIKPHSLLHKLHLIAKNMHSGRQEDAHEFLRFLVDGLQKACLKACMKDGKLKLDKLDKFSRETTVVNHIFGGFLRSQVLCLKCGERSNTFDPFMDISLEIKNVQTIEKAFEKFVQPETLEYDNAYSCPRCRKKVAAQKRLSLHRAPNVLTIQLKRFDYHYTQGKISRHIRFPDKLNLRPYLSQKQGDPVMYSLYAVLVHSGTSCNSGHYFCHVKSPSQGWYCMNDAMVAKVTAQSVFTSEAYMLFYAKTKPPAAEFIGPTMPVNNSLNNEHKCDLVNRSNGKPSSEMGTPVSRKHLSTGGGTPVSRKNLSIGVGTPFSRKRLPTTIPSGTVLPEKRAKVSFGIYPSQTKSVSYITKTKLLNAARKTKPYSTQLKPLSSTPQLKPSSTPQLKPSSSTPQLKPSSSTPQLKPSSSTPQLKATSYGDAQPRIVVQIKHGKATTIQPKLVEHEILKVKSGLVPYENNSDSDQEIKTLNGDVNELKADVSDLQLKKVKSETVVLFDRKLNTTTSVPGNPSLMETSGNQPKEFSLNKSHLNSLKSDLCASPGSKANQNSTWHIHDQDVEPSPSVESCSSTTSVNSTSEWHIKESTPCVKHSDVIHANRLITAPELPASVPYSDISLLKANVSSADEVVTNNGHIISETDGHKKSKKHKKRKHRDIENPETDHSTHKKRKHHKKDRKHRKESIDYVWVEKTKDDIEKCNGKKVIEQAWDYHSAPGNSEKVVRTTWDGTKSSKVAAELEKSSSSKGYGSSVPSWEGGKSNVDLEQTSHGQKCHWDEFDEELDAGKIKKVKVKKPNYGSDNTQNSFQRLLDERRVGKSWSATDHVSGNHHSSSHHNIHSNSSFHPNHWRRHDKHRHSAGSNGHNYRSQYSH